MRHGRPTLRYSGEPRRWLRAGEMNRLLDAYDDAGLEPTWNRERLPGPIPPETAHPISSDLPRALDTAVLYTGLSVTDIEINAMFREIPLGRFRNEGLHLPTWLLLLIVRWGWFTGWQPAAESRRESLHRVRAAADYLERKVTDVPQRQVALYSHGFFLWLLGRELRRRGWESPKRGGYVYLEQARFERED